MAFKKAIEDYYDKKSREAKGVKVKKGVKEKDKKDKEKREVKKDEGKKNKEWLKFLNENYEIFSKEYKDIKSAIVDAKKIFGKGVEDVVLEKGENGKILTIESNGKDSLKLKGIDNVDFISVTDHSISALERRVLEGKIFDQNLSKKNNVESIWKLNAFLYAIAPSGQFLGGKIFGYDLSEKDLGIHTISRRDEGKVTFLDENGKDITSKFDIDENGVVTKKKE